MGLRAAHLSATLSWNSNTAAALRKPLAVSLAFYLMSCWIHSRIVSCMKDMHVTCILYLPSVAAAVCQCVLLGAYHCVLL
jgi:hypothetical protein